ncbi:hypothetical protein Hanom_Chr12g01153411 [Helianthus anomalus]
MESEPNKLTLLPNKLQKLSFMYVTYCKVYHLSSIITENVFDVYKTLQVMYFSPNSMNFLWLNLTKWTPHEGIFVILLSCGVHLVRFNCKIPSCEVHLVRFNHKI